MAYRDRNIFKQKEKLLETFLKEGKIYLTLMEKFYDNLRKEANEYKKMLFVIDRYTRYKTQLREDMEELKEMYDSDILDEIIMYDDDTDGEEDVEYMEINWEELENEFEEEDFYLEEQIHFFRNIVYRKNTLANMEMLILRKLNVDGTLINFQLSMYSKLKLSLKDYCEKVCNFLKHGKIVAKSKDGLEKKRLVKSIQIKCKQLQQLLTKITKKQVFLSQIATQPFIRKKREEESN